MSLVRHLLVALLFAPLAAAYAQGYPDRPVKIIVPFSAGGLTDVLTRALGTRLSAIWNQPVVVENRPGANTAIAAAFVAKSAPDGYTLLLASDATMSINQFLYKRLAYDPVRDLGPVATIAAANQVLIVRNDLGVATFGELVALAKKVPHRLSYGSYGIGSTAHLSTDALAREAGMELNHVPFKGGAEVNSALLGGHLDMAYPSINPVLEWIRSGKVKALATSGPTRSEFLPAVPTFEEAGLRGFTTAEWFGIVAPAHTDPKIVAKIAADVQQVISAPEFRQRHLAGVGLEPLAMGPESFSTFLASDRKKYERMVRTLGLEMQ